MEKTKPASPRRKSNRRSRGGLNPKDYQALLAAVGPELLAKLWLLAVDTHGPRFTLEQCLALVPLAKKPERSYFNEMQLIKPESLYLNDSGEYALAPVSNSKMA